MGDAIGIDWERFDLEQFRAGMDVEYEHGSHDPQTDVTGDDPITTGKIALAHMKEFPDYYERLERMEEEAKRDRAETSAGHSRRWSRLGWCCPGAGPRSPAVLKYQCGLGARGRCGAALGAAEHQANGEHDAACEGHLGD